MQETCTTQYIESCDKSRFEDDIFKSIYFYENSFLKWYKMQAPVYVYLK